MKLRFWRRSGHRIRGEINRSDIGGPVTIGADNRVESHVKTDIKTDVTTVLSDAEAARLHELLARLRAQVADASPDVMRAAALHQVDQLEAALVTTEPDASRTERVLAWFREHLPEAAGAVMSVVVHPIVGKLVAAAGDAVVHEFEDVT